MVLVEGRVAVQSRMHPGHVIVERDRNELEYHHQLDALADHVTRAGLLPEDAEHFVDKLRALREQYKEIDE